MPPNETPCPICHKPVEGRRFRPFCSARCADIDLGRWLTGQYVLSGPEAEADAESGEENTALLDRLLGLG